MRGPRFNHLVGSPESSTYKTTTSQTLRDYSSVAPSRLILLIHSVLGLYQKELDGGRRLRWSGLGQLVQATGAEDGACVM